MFRSSLVSVWSSWYIYCSSDSKFYQHCCFRRIWFYFVDWSIFESYNYSSFEPFCPPYRFFYCYNYTASIEFGYVYALDRIKLLSCISWTNLSIRRSHTTYSFGNFSLYAIAWLRPYSSISSCWCVYLKFSNDYTFAALSILLVNLISNFFINYCL